MPKLYRDGEVIAMVKPEVAKGRFLELYMLTGHIGKTCEILGINSRTVHHWRNYDEQFKLDYEMADRVALGLLEDEATRRAVYGVKKPVFQGGKFVGYVTEYSDQLLIVLLKAKAPDKYKDSWKGELTGADGKPLMPETKIVHVHSNLSLANNEDEVSIDRTIRIESGPVQQAEVVSSKLSSDDLSILD